MTILKNNVEKFCENVTTLTKKISFSMKSKSFSQTYRWLGRARTVAWFRTAFNVPNTSRGEKSNSNRERIRTQCNDKTLLEKNNTVVQNESN